MSYAKETRPDAMGRIAYSQQNVDKDACVEHLIEANGGQVRDCAARFVFPVGFSRFSRARAPGN